MAIRFYKIQPIVLMTVLFILAFSIPGWSKTMYVTDTFQITVRAGKGTDFKILHMLSSGAPVKIVGQEDLWSHVELENGQRGWVLTRYLMDGPPKSTMIEQLNQKLETQQLRIDRIADENAALKKSNEELLKQADSFKIDSENTKKKYEELLTGSSEYLEVKNKYESLKADHEKLAGQFNALQRENENLKQKSELYWFLSGSLVLLVGLIVGISLGRLQRKRKFYS